ncbi:hypothetical protein [Pararhodobacter aggregans]|nr:hypothetical protein [Pararhodobacter aggregans]
MRSGFENNDLQGEVAARRDAAFPHEINGVGRPTSPRGGIENKGQNPRLSNEISMRRADAESENPGALAGATGVKSKEPIFRTQEYRERFDAARALIGAIRSCHPEEAVPIMAAALDSLTPEYAGGAFRTVMEEAECWAALATKRERKAYVLQGFKAMPLADRRSFMAYAHRWLA